MSYFHSLLLLFSCPFFPSSVLRYNSLILSFLFSSFSPCTFSCPPIFTFSSIPSHIPLIFSLSFFPNLGLHSFSSSSFWPPTSAITLPPFHLPLFGLLHRLSLCLLFIFLPCHSFFLLFSSPPTSLFLPLFLSFPSLPFYFLLPLSHSPSPLYTLSSFPSPFLTSSSSSSTSPSTSFSFFPLSPV